VIDWMQQKYKSHKSKAALQYEVEVTKRMIASDVINLGDINSSRINHIADIYKKNNVELKNASINGLIYSEHYKTESNYKLVAIVICIVLILLIVLLFIVFWINNRLKQGVHERTLEIEKSKRFLEQYAQLFDENIYLIYLNKDAKIEKLSQKFRKKFSLLEDRIKDKNILSDFESLIFSDKQRVILNTSINSLIVADGECIIIDDNNKRYLFDFHISHLKDNNGILEESIIILSDVTEKKTIESRSLTDTLTQIANRYSLNKSLVKIINEANESDSKLSVIMIDIDHFKRVNDRLGHNIGDKVLKKMAQILVSNTDGQCLVGRWGGEEFLVVCNQYDLDKAKQLAEQLRVEIEKTQIDDSYKLTASLGVAQFKLSESIEQLINRADDALYKAKSSGRNNVKISEAE